MSYEVLLVYTIVSNAMLLLIVIVQAIALSNHKCEIAILTERVKDEQQRTERAQRELMRKTGSGVGIAERERDGQRRIEHVTRRLTGTELRRQQQDHIAEAAARSAPQAQGLNDLGNFTLGIVAGQMLTGAAPRHDACVSPPQAPSVESTGPSPSCEAPSPSSSYDSSPSSSSDSGSSFSGGGTD